MIENYNNPPQPSLKKDGVSRIHNNFRFTPLLLQGVAISIYKQNNYLIQIKI